MVRRNPFEEIAMAILGLFVIAAMVSALSPSLGTFMAGIFYLFIFLVFIALIVKIIEFFNQFF